MPEWLESELARHLAPVEAPPTLVFPAKQRRTFTLAPILAVAAAIAVAVLATVPPRPGVAEVNRYLQARAGVYLTIPADTTARFERVRLVRPGVAAVTYGQAGTKSTVLIARASAVSGNAWKSHGAYAINGPCVLCHAL